MGIPGNISKGVVDYVKATMKLEGKKKAIDTEAEYKQLSEYIANGGLSNAEKEYVEGYKQTYEAQQKEKAEKEEQALIENSLTPDVKKDIKKLMTRNGLVDKVGAEALADMLENRDLNQFERKYIMATLDKSGFANMIPGEGSEPEPSTAANIAENKFL